jgi:ABC-2 type transport system permease protein
MNKLWLIIKREYLSRVVRRAFILGTILTPLGIGALIFVNIKLATYKDDNFQNIAIRDESGILTQAPENQTNIHFSLTKERLDDLKMQVLVKKYDGVLVIPPIADPMSKKFTLKYYSDDKLGGDMSNDIEKKVAESIRKYKINVLQLDTAKIAALKTDIDIDPDPITGTKNASTMSGAVGMGIGIMMGFIMYMSVFIYGMMIFRSVMEEKTSRIVEVMISSVRPFQLMLGKIIGVGAAGFTQIIVWVILVALIVTGITAKMGGEAVQNLSNSQMASGANAEAMKQVQASGEMAQLLTEFQNQNWIVILPLFFIFFLLGYFMYAALFAAVGSAVGDDQGEAQSLTLPITIPVILAIYIMIAAVRAPESSLAVWSSIFPLFSPIVMPARLPFGPPMWQVALSITLLVATVISLIWLAGRIYRVGILMYGKKVTFRELGKWMFYKD